LLHEGVTDAAKVDPHVRKLVRKERPRVEQLAVVDRFPLVGRAIGLIAFWRQWMRRRAETENVGQQPLVVALPAVRDESGLRPPAVSECRSAIAGPVPVGTLVERVGKAADLGLCGRVTVKIARDRQDTCKQERRIDRRKLTLPNAAAGFDVQKVVEEALVAGGVGFGTLRALKQVAQPSEGEL